MLCEFSSLWWPFGWNWSYLGFLGIIWRTCGSKCRGEGGGIFPTLCVECCLVVIKYLLSSILLSSSNRKYQPFPLLSYFSVVVCLRWLYHHMLSVSYIYIYISRYSWVLFLLLLCSLVMSANNRVHYGLMVVLICLHITLPHYHHYANVSEGIELIICLSGTFFQVCV